MNAFKSGGAHKALRLNESSRGVYRSGADADVSGAEVLRVGRRVRVLNGPMQGQNGTIEAIKPGQRVQLSMETGGSENVTVELHARWLKPA